MRKCNTLLAFAVLTAAAFPAVAAEPPAPASPPASVSPAIQEAINDFNSDDFKTRTAASKKLQLALAQQLRAFTSSANPEVLSRLPEILEFDDSLTRWIIDTLKLSPDQRQARLQFGLQPDILPLLALIHSAESEQRVAGIKALAKVDKPEVITVLAPLLNDPDRAVYIAAMEAFWDKKPNAAVVDSLWTRAMEETPASSAPSAPENDLTFRNQPVPPHYPSLANFTVRHEDANIAVEVLIHFQAPEVEKKIIAYLVDWDKFNNPDAAANANLPAAGPAVGRGGQGNGNIVGIAGGGGADARRFNTMADPAKNVFKLIAAYRPKACIPLLYKLATAPIRQKINGANKIERWFASNRTPAFAALVILTGQKPEDYNLKAINIFLANWAFPSWADESAAIKKLHDWYAANVDKNVPDITEEPGNAPGAAPPAGPAMKKTAPPAQPATSEPAKP